MRFLTIFCQIRSLNYGINVLYFLYKGKEAFHFPFFIFLIIIALLPGWWNGRHWRLKISWPHGRTGSSPVPGIEKSEFDTIRF